MFMNAMINSFIMTTNNNQVGARREFASKGLREPATLRGHQDDKAAFIPQRFHRGENRLRFHDHSLTAPEWCVIDNVVLVGRPVAQVMDAQVERTAFLRALHHAFRKRGATGFWEKRQNIDAHSPM